MFVGPEHDRLMIRELVDRYSDAVARRDPDAWGATWAEDAVWRFGGREIVGKDAIVSAWHGAMGQYEALVFLAFPGALSVTEDRAQLRTHTYEHLVPVNGPPRIQTGIYEDELIRRDETWLFATRSFNAKEIKA